MTTLNKAVNLSLCELPKLEIFIYYFFNVVMITESGKCLKYEVFNTKIDHVVVKFYNLIKMVIVLVYLFAAT